MSEYVKECIFCKAKIRMRDKEGGKWLPFNEDGSQHDCKKGKNEITLEAVQKKLESLGIIINVERLMKNG
jgi:hypothetical protein